MAETPALSVVVIGRNEGNRLSACFESIWGAARTPQPLELIYVDSSSTDDSPARAAELGVRVIELKGGKLSAARARNAGWRSATAPLILFLDGDTLLHRDFLTRAMEALNDPRVAVVCGHRRESHADESIYNRLLDLDWIYKVGVTEFCGGDALMRRVPLEQAGGFDADLIAGEEPDLCRRMRASGHLILRVDAPMTSHDLAIFHFNQYWRRAVRTGHAYAEIAARYRGTADPFWSKESHDNVLRGFLYICTSLGLCLTSLLWNSWVPIYVGLFSGAAVAVRTALRSRWKGGSWRTLLLFGIHSHIQHVPILQGQLLYRWGRWRGQNHRLIEYKGE